MLEVTRPPLSLLQCSQEDDDVNTDNTMMSNRGSAMDVFRASIERGDEALKKERIARAYASRAARAAPGKCVPKFPASSVHVDALIFV